MMVKRFDISSGERIRKTNFMARSEIIALMMDGENLRCVRYVPKGAADLARADGGVWPVVAPSVEGDENGIPPAELPDEEGDTPLLAAVRSARRALGGGDVVVAFPLSSLLVHILKMPVEMREDLQSAVALQMDKIAPFDDGEYSTGYEVLSEDEEHIWVLASAMSHATFDALNDPLSAVGWRVVRSDIGMLGWLRVLCAPLKLNSPGRRIVLSLLQDVWTVMVINNGTLVMARSFGGVSGYAALVRELTLSMMSVEIEAGVLAVGEILVVADERPDSALFDKLQGLFAVTPEYHKFPSVDGGVEGVALRSSEKDVVDLTPQYWHDTLKENATRKKVMTFAGVACVIWAVGMAILFGGPLVYRHMTGRVRDKSKAHYRAYKAVSDTRERVNLILSYTDRQYSPLEILRVISGYLPRGITLTGFNFKKQDGVRISGEAQIPSQVYSLKEAIDADDIFVSSTLTGPSASREGHKFEIAVTFPAVEVDE